MGIFGRRLSVSRPHEKEFLIWKIPNSTYPKISDVKEIIVRDFEKAISYKNGEISDFYSSGKHKLDRVDEIIWVDTSEFKQLYGIPKRLGLKTSDNVKVGFHGYITLQVSTADEKNKWLLTRVPWKRKELTKKELVSFLKKGLLPTVFRDAIKGLTLREFENLEREALMKNVSLNLDQELNHYGLKLISIDILGYVMEK